MKFQRASSKKCIISKSLFGKVLNNKESLQRKNVKIIRFPGKALRNYSFFRRRFLQLYFFRRSFLELYIFSRGSLNLYIFPVRLIGIIHYSEEALWTHTFSEEALWNFNISPLLGLFVIEHSAEEAL